MTNLYDFINKYLITCGTCEANCGGNTYYNILDYIKENDVVSSPYKNHLLAKCIRENIQLPGIIDPNNADIDMYLASTCDELAKILAECDEIKQLL